MQKRKSLLSVKKALLGLSNEANHNLGWPLLVITSLDEGLTLLSSWEIIPIQAPEGSTPIPALICRMTGNWCPIKRKIRKTNPVHSTYIFNPTLVKFQSTMEHKLPLLSNMQFFCHQIHAGIYLFTSLVLSKLFHFVHLLFFSFLLV